MTADRDSANAVERALRRLEQTEPEIRAWVRVDADGARAAARRAPDGPLHGMPFGVKDIIDVAGLPTECGSVLRRGRTATGDAWLVDRLRRAGAVPLGKTVTTEFAYFQPGPTRNPHNPSHTPGGSSSGSAAAVAAGVVPLALGSQTAGSLTRPASFCGAAGYVAPVGAWSTQGFTGLSPSLDAPGLLTAGVADLAAVIEAVDGTTAEVPDSVRVLVWEGTELADIDPAMLDALRRTGRALRSGGADHRDGQGGPEDLPPVVGTRELADAHAVVMAYEAARTLAAEAEHPEALSGHLNELLERGRQTSDDAYRAALSTARTARASVLHLLTRVDAILGPAAPGPAPHGLNSTGTPVLSRPWQLLGLPAVTVPGHRDPHGMPLGLQLVGHPDRVGRLLGVARRVEEAVR
ncbi:amidase [Streptomyces sporangiiformans]|uniref:Amidase n=1 Tax=Streptomyces sporangiiformans TaxID=2315329 RepID=A0A505DMY4_9ACTN|nr:amidase [Streptomyces sporangiiformans]TPQ21091.1 amidase [Streptomyces sporangiiformans]